jgi:hypothetical protein
MEFTPEVGQMDGALTDRERPERLRAAKRSRRKDHRTKRGGKHLGAVAKPEIRPPTVGRVRGGGNAGHVPAAPVLGAAVARGGADGAGPLQRQREVVELALRPGQGRAGGALDGQPRSGQRPCQQHARRLPRRRCRHCLRRRAVSSLSPVGC